MYVVSHVSAAEKIENRRTKGIVGYDWNRMFVVERSSPVFLRSKRVVVCQTLVQLVKNLAECNTIVHTANAFVTWVNNFS